MNDQAQAPYQKQCARIYAWGSHQCDGTFWVVPGDKRSESRRFCSLKCQQANYQQTARRRRAAGQGRGY